MNTVFIIQWKKIIGYLVSITIVAVGVFLAIYLYGEDYYPLIAVLIIVALLYVLAFYPSTIILNDKTIRSLFGSSFQKSFCIKTDDIISVNITRLYIGLRYRFGVGYFYICELVIYLKGDESVGITLNYLSQKDEWRILDFFRKKGFDLSLLEDESIETKNTKCLSFYGCCYNFFSDIGELILLILFTMTALALPFVFGFDFLLFATFSTLPLIVFASAYNHSCFKIKINNEYIISRRISLYFPLRAQDGWTINLKKVERISFEMFEYDYRGKHYKTNGNIYNMIHFHYRDGNSRYLIRTMFSKKQLFNLLDYCKKYKVIIEKPDKDPTIKKDWIFDYFTSDNEDKII